MSAKQLLDGPALLQKIRRIAFQIYENNFEEKIDNITENNLESIKEIKEVTEEDLATPGANILRHRVLSLKHGNRIS